jgi:hypothetical protein
MLDPNQARPRLQQIDLLWRLNALVARAWNPLISSERARCLCTRAGCKPEVVIDRLVTQAFDFFTARSRVIGHSDVAGKMTVPLLPV